MPSPTLRLRGVSSVLIVVCCGVVGLACDDEASGSGEKASCDATVWFRDVDGDGSGDADGPYDACEAPIGHVANADDCNDQDPEVRPGAAEACDGVDNDCNGAIDDGADGGAATWFADVDSDGFGDPESATEACIEPDGFVGNSEDCNDDDPGIHPDADDLPRDGVDGDCDGVDAETLSERAHVGDLALLDAGSVDAFCADYDAVVGDLQLAGPALSGELTIDCLVEVSGDLLVSTDSVSMLSLPALWWVGGELRMAGNPSLVDLDMGGLRFVDGPLVMLDNALLDAPVFGALGEVGALPRVDSAVLPVLTDVHGDVALSAGLAANALERVDGALSIADGALEVVSLPSLISVGPLELRSVRATTVALDALTRADAVSVELPDLGGALSLPALETIDGDFIVEQGPHTVSADALTAVGGILSLTHDGIENIALDSLSTVGGDLLLGGPDLSTSTLSAVETVGGALSWMCPGCIEFSVPALQSIGGDVALTGGSDTTSLHLSALETSGGGLALVDLDKVRDIDLSALTTVGGPVLISELEWAESVDLAALVNPPAEVELRSLPALTTVDLSSLRLGGVRGELVVLDNPLLDSINLDALASEAGTIRIQGNSSLTSIDLSGLLFVGQLTVSGPLDELDLSQLGQTTGALDVSLDTAHTLDLGLLQQVGGDFTVAGPLETLVLSSLELVGGTASINASDPASLDLGALREVLTDLTIQLNLAETLDVSSLETVVGTATFQHGTELLSLSLPVLDSVSILTVRSLGGLQTLSAGSLVASSSDVNVVENTELETLDGLDTLETVGGSLAIVGNLALDDVSALSGVTSIVNDLRIQDNVELLTADAEALAYDDIGAANVGGGITISGNAP